MTQPQPDQQVIIIGAGLAGMTAGLHLARRGLSVLLLEADPNFPGGRLQGGAAVTLEHNGRTWSFPGEHGLHGVWGQYHNLRAMLAREDIDPGFVPAKEEAWILRHPKSAVQWTKGGSALRKSWIPAPFHYLALFIRPRFLQMLTLRDLASMFRVLGGLIFATAYDPAVEDARLDRFTLADFFKGWSPTLQSLFLGLARNFTSARPDQVPQAGFIAFLRFYTLLRRDAWRFNYFNRDSHSALIAPLQARIEAAGGKLQLGAQVTDLIRDGEGWRVQWQQPPSSEAVPEAENEISEANASHVILALDIPGARKLLTHSLSAHALTWSMAVPSVVVRYWFNRKPKGSSAEPEAGIFTGEFILDNYFWLHRIQAVFGDWSQVTGGSAVECHIYGPPEILLEPDAVLLARGLQDIGRVWPELRSALITQSIRRNAATHSLFSGNTDQGLSVQTPWSQLWACGDWVRYPHGSLYMERAVVTGLAAANGVLTAKNLPTYDIQPVDPPEILVRWIERLLRWVRRRARSYGQRREQN
ncbi:MAG: FAD-dependent oxidoreductase [Anaerolineae bacterium]|nr:FAD-dependent oxidoreductase [Anaerolineae bacterium]